MSTPLNSTDDAPEAIQESPPVVETPNIPNANDESLPPATSPDSTQIVPPRVRTAVPTSSPVPDTVPPVDEDVEKTPSAASSPLSPVMYSPSPQPEVPPVNEDEEAPSESAEYLRTPTPEVVPAGLSYEFSDRDGDADAMAFASDPRLDSLRIAVDVLRVFLPTVGFEGRIKRDRCRIIIDFLNLIDRVMRTHRNIYSVADEFSLPCAILRVLNSIAMILESVTQNILNGHAEVRDGDVDFNKWQVRSHPFHEGKASVWPVARGAIPGCLRLRNNQTSILPDEEIERRSKERHKNRNRGKDKQVKAETEPSDDEEPEEASPKVRASKRKRQPSMKAMSAKPSSKRSATEKTEKLAARVPLVINETPSLLTPIGKAKRREYMPPDEEDGEDDAPPPAKRSRRLPTPVASSSRTTLPRSSVSRAVKARNTKASAKGKEKEVTHDVPEAGPSRPRRATARNASAVPSQPPVPSPHRMTAVTSRVNVDNEPMFVYSAGLLQPGAAHDDDSDAEAPSPGMPEQDPPSPVNIQRVSVRPEPSEPVEATGDTSQFSPVGSGRPTPDIALRSAELQLALSDWRSRRPLLLPPLLPSTVNLPKARAAVNAVFPEPIGTDVPLTLNLFDFDFLGSPVVAQGFESVVEEAALLARQEQNLRDHISREQSLIQSRIVTLRRFNDTFLYRIYDLIMQTPRHLRRALLTRIHGEQSPEFLLQTMLSCFCDRRGLPVPEGM